MKKVALGHCVEFTRKTGVGQVGYHKWFGDLYECPGCKAQVVAGWGREPLQSFDERYVRYEADIVVPEL